MTLDPPKNNIYTSEQVLALAPDAGAQKAGQDLANTRRWVRLACGIGVVWGECQGSGGSPYRTSVDLNGPAFKCSCPSRKFPCKHGIALLLLYSLSPASFNDVEQPKWVNDWMAGRNDRSKKKENKDEVEKDRTPEQIEEAKLSKEKRRQSRMDNVAAGVEELELFLCDLIRQGVGHLKSEGYAFFENRAARLIDAQAPGLARLIRECATITSGQNNWQETLLNRLATIYLITRAFKNLNNLPPLMQEDVLSAVGFTQSQESLAATDGVSDRWYALGQITYIEDKLRVQKTWLRGLSSQRTAMILSFAHGTAPFDLLLVPGHIYDTELVFYPSNFPLRAMFKSKGEADVTDSSAVNRPEGVKTLQEALGQYADALSRLPWLEAMPVLLNEQILLRSSDVELFSSDTAGNALPLKTDYMAGWQLSAFSGGKPITLFAEFDGIQLRPLAAIHDQSGAYLRL